MKIVKGLPRVKPRGGLALTLGVFDGVHRGHRAILRTLIRRARAAGLPAAALTFDRHPARVLSPSYAPAPLYSPRANLAFLAQQGLDRVYLLPFTAALSRMDAEDFVRKVLVGRLATREMVVGYDFVFGRHGRGDKYLLARMGRELGFGVTAAPPAMSGGEPVSSTRVRSAVQAGEMALAGRLLGRPYRIQGRVVRGRGLGKKIGRPTANVEVKYGLLPGAGVWGGRARVEGRKAWHAFVGNWGRRPTVEDGGAMRLEAHLLDFDGRLLGRVLEIEMNVFLRGERKFASLEALRAQITRDERNFRRRLKRR